MKRLAAILMATILMFGCATTSSVKNSLTYFKDQSTGQCFAWIRVYNGQSFSGEISVTYVPCTPEVEKHLEKEQ